MAQPAVECECGRAVPLPEDRSGPLTCPCGNRVVIPPSDEFRGRSLVLSAMTVERRVRRLLAVGELPPMGACARCGEQGDVEPVELWLDCEQSQVRVSGGNRFLFIPGINLFLFWEEERRTEVLGHDTSVPVPLCLCPTCAPSLGRPSGGGCLAAAVVIALSAVLGYFNWLARIAVGFVGLATVLWRCQRRGLQWQHDLKTLLRKVPAYGQLLDQFRFATVAVPENRKKDRGDRLSN